MKKERKKINKDDFFIHMFVWTWIYIIIISIFIFFSINVKAADNDFGLLPIRTPETIEYFDLSEDSLGISAQAVFDYGHEFLCDTYNISEDTEYFIVLYNVVYNSYLTGRWRFYMKYVFSPTFNASVYDDTNFLNQNMVFSGDIYGFGCDWQYGVSSTLHYMQYGLESGSDITLYGSNHSVVTYTDTVNQAGIKSVSYVPVWIVSYFGEDILSSNDKVVLTNSTGVEPPFNYTGHATAPTGLPDYFPNINLQHTPTVPTFNSYTFTTYNSPTIDTSSVSSLLESLIDIVVYNFEYLLYNLLGMLQNLFNNITSLFDFLIAWIQYAVKALITNIVNFMQNIYENIVSLFEPFFDMMHDLYLKFLLFVLKAQDFIDLFINPFDYDEFEADLDNWEFKNRTDDLAHSFSDFVAIFSSAHEPETYTLYIGWLQEMPDHSFREINCDQNLDWLNDIKPKYKPVLWVVTLVELFQFITTHVSHFIGGKYK